MTPGLNTELHRRGRVVHVQTEMTGRPPLIVTQVFVGGSVIFSRRTSLKENAQPSDLTEARGAMLAQHKEVHQAVERGLYDEKLLAGRGTNRGDIPLANAPYTPNKPPKA